MNPSIFRAYDIRGKYPEEINEKIAQEVAEKVGKFLLNKANRHGKFVLGEDVRQSSPSLYKAVIEGLKKIGVSKNKIILLGETTTPMFYFISAYYNAIGGFMITSSHNPKNTNGIKIIGKDISFISGEDAQKIIYKK